MTTTFLRIEGLILGAAAVAFYHFWGFSWVLFVLLLLVPDVSMAGYLKSNRLGALLYNIGHSHILPAVLMAVGLARDWPMGTAVAVIWFAHIGMDRALGFGLKDTSGFADTHLGHLGRVHWANGSRVSRL